MATIIAGRVETQQRADDLMEQLQSRGIAARDMQAFYVNPPGQHGTYPIGGDMDADTGTEESGVGQAAGVAAGAAAGLAAGAVVGAAIPPLAPIIAVAMAGVGAHVGGMAGALASTRTSDEEKAGNRNFDARPRCGRHAARWNDAGRARRPGHEKTVIDLLRPRRSRISNAPTATGRTDNGLTSIRCSRRAKSARESRRSVQQHHAKPDHGTDHRSSGDVAGIVQSKRNPRKRDQQHHRNQRRSHKRKVPAEDDCERHRVQRVARRKAELVERAHTGANVRAGHERTRPSDRVLQPEIQRQVQQAGEHHLCGDVATVGATRSTPARQSGHTKKVRHPAC